MMSMARRKSQMGMRMRLASLERRPLGGIGEVIQGMTSDQSLSHGLKGDSVASSTRGESHVHGNST